MHADPDLINIKTQALNMHAITSHAFCMQSFTCFFTQVLDEPLHKKTNNLHLRKQIADQPCSNCTADQRLCFRSIDSVIPLLLKSEISRF